MPLRHIDSSQTLGPTRTFPQQENLHLKTHENKSYCVMQMQRIYNHFIYNLCLFPTASETMQFVPCLIAIH